VVPAGDKVYRTVAIPVEMGNEGRGDFLRSEYWHKPEEFVFIINVVETGEILGNLGYI
jgi:hypothetical protein